MASSPSNSSQFEPAIIEQVITEFFAKSLHIILESRSPYVSSRNYSGDLSAAAFTGSGSPASSSNSSSSSGVRPRDKWFNLALRDCPAALENFDLWRQSNLDPLVVDIVLARVASASHGFSGRASPGGCLPRTLSNKERYFEPMPDSKSEKIVERWVIQYETRRSDVGRDSKSGGQKYNGGSSSGSHSSEMPAMYRKTYKRSIVLLRSLYVTVRLLPAYKLFRALNSSGQLRPFSLSHKISSFVEPFTRKEDAEMNQFVFAPVETPCGRLCLSVSYLSTVDDVSFETSTPLSTQLIPDYVGSPTTDPLRRFQSLPTAASLPNYVSFGGRHSWSNDQGASTPSGSQTPSPTYSDPRASHYSQNPNLPPRAYLHDYSLSGRSAPSKALVPFKKKTTFDEYYPSPPFTPSSSPSAQTYLPSGHLTSALLRTESAPVSIPSPRPGSSGLPSPGLPPSPSLKGVRQGMPSQSGNVRAQTTAALQTSSPGKVQMKKETLRLADIQSGMALQKVLSLGKDEARSLPGLKISSVASPCITFSRSPSRLSLLDEFDDPNFACPFAPDDEDASDSCSGVERIGGRQPNENLEPGGSKDFRKTQDAAVGALIKTFKTAAPLHKDLLGSAQSSQGSREVCTVLRFETSKPAEIGEGNLDHATTSPYMSASGQSKSRTTAEAFEELRSYREIKEKLLKQGGFCSLDGQQETRSVDRGASGF